MPRRSIPGEPFSGWSSTVATLKYPLTVACTVVGRPHAGDPVPFCLWPVRGALLRVLWPAPMTRTCLFADDTIESGVRLV